MNLIIVTTGGGFAFDDAVKYLVEALGEGNPLPDNAAGVADLEKALVEAVQPPAAQPVPLLPDTAYAISGHTYIFDDNPYRLASMRLDFDQSAEATLHMTYYSDIADRGGAVGLDGQYRLVEVSDGPAEKFLVGMRGFWSDAQTFVLDYNQVASPNAMMLSVHFDADRLLIEGPGVDWEGNVSIEGRQE
jgi:hypothetical protein